MKLQVLTESGGMVIYDGPSRFTGERIVVVATGLARRSRNGKTGDMIQTWIFCGKTDLNPSEALLTGDDESVCGSCKHRHFGSCYVNCGQGPYQIWDAWRQGRYPKARPRNLEAFRDRDIRFGTYGDPVAVPLNIWESIMGVAANWTGYTHAWRQSRAQGYRKLCMASADTELEARDARSRGWKPFLVRLESDPIPEGFFVCPASKEAGKRLSCTECKVCHGGDWRTGQGSPTIIAHGPSWKRKFFQLGIKAFNQKQRYRDTRTRVMAA
jgi:hypothetical protein